MPLLLNIDTATEHASVCINRDNEVLGIIESTEQKNHASFVQPAIHQLASLCGFSLKAIDAVSVTAGPGSYTGLRVGLASAKGICYALDKPLLLVNTLEVMAHAVCGQSMLPGGAEFVCPLIDARRMEVFTAVYDMSMKQIVAPHALVLDAGAYASILQSHRVIFTGSGHPKLRTVLSSSNASYNPVQHNAGHLARRALIAWQSNSFADLAYCEPFYLKEFFHPVKNSIKG